MDVEQLFDAHYGAVVAYARRRGASWDEGHDVAAEVFAVAWRRRADVPLGFERAWLLGVARRVQANHFRAARRRHSLVARIAGSSRPVAPDVAGVTDDLQLAAALAVLSPQDREVLRLTAWDGLGLAEVGVVLGCSEAAATSRAARARTRLRRALDAQDEPSLRGT